MKIQPEFNIASIISRISAPDATGLAPAGAPAGAAPGLRAFPALFEAALQEIDDPQLAATLATYSESGMLTPDSTGLQAAPQPTGDPAVSATGSGHEAAFFETVRLLNGRAILTTRISTAARREAAQPAVGETLPAPGMAADMPPPAALLQQRLGVVPQAVQTPALSADMALRQRADVAALRRPSETPAAAPGSARPLAVAAPGFESASVSPAFLRPTPREAATLTTSQASQPAPTVATNLPRPPAPAPVLPAAAEQTSTPAAAPVPGQVRDAAPARQNGQIAAPAPMSTLAPTPTPTPTPAQTPAQAPTPSPAPMSTPSPLSKSAPRLQPMPVSGRPDPLAADAAPSDPRQGVAAEVLASRQDRQPAPAQPNGQVPPHVQRPPQAPATSQAPRPSPAAALTSTTTTGAAAPLPSAVVRILSPSGVPGAPAAAEPPQAPLSDSPREPAPARLNTPTLAPLPAQAPTPAQMTTPPAMALSAAAGQTAPADGLTDTPRAARASAEPRQSEDATSGVRTAEPTPAEAAPRAMLQILTPAGVPRPAAAPRQTSAGGTRPGPGDAMIPADSPRPLARTGARVVPGLLERGLNSVSEAVSDKPARDGVLREESGARDIAPVPSPLNSLRAAFEPSPLTDANASQGSAFSLPPLAVAESAGAAESHSRAPVREAPSRESWMRFEDLNSQFGGEIRKASLETDGTGRAALRIMLAPENMGTIEAEVIESNNTVTINIVAQTEEVVRVLRENSHALREAFSGHSATEINIFRDTGGNGAQHAGGRQSGATSPQPEPAHDSSAAGAKAVDAASAGPTPAQLDTYV